MRATFKCTKGSHIVGGLDLFSLAPKGKTRTVEKKL